MHNHQTSRIAELALSLDPKGYPTGKSGNVWATVDLRQAEIIRNALLTQHITCELKEAKYDGITLHLLRVADARESEEATDFIWRDDSGLRLRPDWHYSMGSENESFDKWINGT